MTSTSQKTYWKLTSSLLDAGTGSYSCGWHPKHSTARKKRISKRTRGRRIFNLHNSRGTITGICWNKNRNISPHSMLKLNVFFLGCFCRSMFIYRSPQDNSSLTFPRDSMFFILFLLWHYFFYPHFPFIYKYSTHTHVLYILIWLVTYCVIFFQAFKGYQRIWENFHIFLIFLKWSVF